MNAHTTMIMLIAVLAVTTAGVVVFYQITGEAQQTANNIQNQQDDASPSLEIVNIIASDIEDDTYHDINIQIEYTGDEQLALNETFIQIRTEQSVADIYYGNNTSYTG
jgi:hypothetical protein